MPLQKSKIPARAKRVKFSQEQKDKRPQIQNGKSFASAKEQKLVYVKQWCKMVIIKFDYLKNKLILF